MTSTTKEERAKAKRERRKEVAPPPRPPRHVPVRLPGPGWPEVAIAVALAAGAAALYVPCLDGAFVFDDPNSVTQSSLVRSLTPLTRFVTLSTRPLTDFSFALDYAQGGFEPRLFHRTNIFLHAANTVLVFVFAWLALGTPALAQRAGRARRWLAAAAAAAFAAHPLATETVAYISSRSEVLVGVFFFSTLILYDLAASGTSRVPRILLPFCTAAALGTKEIAVVLPAALLLYDWCFLARGKWQRTRPRWSLVGLSAIPLGIGLAFLAWRAASPTGLGAYGATAGFGFDRFTRWQYLFTQFGVLVHYLRLLVYPAGLTFDYDWPLASGFLSFEVIVPLLLLAGLVWFAVRSVEKLPSLAFAVLWMLLVLAPTSSILPIADIAVERRMYLTLAGWALLGATALWDLARRLSDAAGAPARVAIVFAVLAALPLSAWSIATVDRAALWGDSIELHRDGVAKAPGNPRVRLNLGVTYMNLGRLPEAQKELAEAKRLYDLGVSVHAFERIGAFIHYNLGASLYLQGKGKEAVPQLERALELGGVYLALRPMAYYLLARIAFQNDDYDAATKRFEEALRYNRDNAGWFSELAGAYVKTGRLPDAQKAIQRGLRVHPGNPDLTAALQRVDKMSAARQAEVLRQRRAASAAQQAPPSPAPE